MNAKNLIIRGIVGGILFFLLGWLFYGVFLTDFMNKNPGKVGNIERREMEFVFLIIGNLLQGFLFAYIFVKSNINSLAAGLITGAIIGFLMSSSVDCVMYGTTLVLSKKGMMADVIAFTIMSAIIGAVLGALGAKDINNN